MKTYTRDQREIGEGKYRALISRPVVHRIDADQDPAGIDTRVESNEGVLRSSRGISAREIHLNRLIEERRLSVSPEFVMGLAGLTGGRPGQYAVVYQGHTYLLTIDLKRLGIKHGEHSPIPTIINLRMTH